MVLEIEGPRELSSVTPKSRTEDRKVKRQKWKVKSLKLLSDAKPDELSLGRVFLVGFCYKTSRGKVREKDH